MIRHGGWYGNDGNNNNTKDMHHILTANEQYADPYV